MKLRDKRSRATIDDRDVYPSRCNSCNSTFRIIPCEIAKGRESLCTSVYTTYVHHLGLQVFLSYGLLSGLNISSVASRDKPTMATTAYQPISSATDEDGAPIIPQTRPAASRRAYFTLLAVLAGCTLFVLGYAASMVLPGFDFGDSKKSCPCANAPDVPQYFQTSPELWAGPTATGKAPFMAQTVTFNPTATYVPNEPLRTAIPVEGMTDQDPGIFKMMGYLSPYTPSPGFGVNEYPLPQDAEIVQVQMLSRHGARYPTRNSNVYDFGKRIAGADELKASGPLAFLNAWEYQLGQEILVQRGRQELFDSGVLHSYMYSQLYNPNSKIIVRTTTQDRMLKSAEYFVAGFFGLEWTSNATIEVIIEQDTFNNSLAGWLNCPNGRKAPRLGNEAQKVWVNTYLQNGKPPVIGYDSETSLTAT